MAAEEREMSRKLGEKIREARKFADLTQEDLAAKASGVSLADLKKIEAGEMEPTTAQLKAIAEAAGVSSKPLIELAQKTGAALSDEELKLVRLYRKASEAKRKSVMEILRQDTGSDIEDLVQNILGGLTGSGGTGNAGNASKDDALSQILQSAIQALNKK